MSTLYGRFFEPGQFARPYGQPEEHLQDMVRACELLLSVCLFQMGADRALALLSGREMLEGLLPEDPDGVRKEVLRDYDKARFHIDARAEASAEEGAFLALQYVRELWKLNEPELFAFMLALLPRYDGRFGQVFAFLEGKRGPCQPSLELSLRLFHFARRAEQVPGYHAQLRSLEQKARFAFLTRSGGADPRACQFVLQNGETELESSAARVYLPGSLGELPVREELAARLAGIVSGDGPDLPPPVSVPERAKGRGPDHPGPPDGGAAGPARHRI